MEDAKFIDIEKILKEKATTFYRWMPGFAIGWLKKKLHEAGINFIGEEKEFVKKAEAGLSTCEALISRTGSILLSSANSSGRRLTIYPEKHLVVARASQLVPDIKDGLNLLRGKYEGKMPSMISLVSGPSRTADIEKTLVLGAHGPKQLVLFLIDDLLEP